MIFRRYAEPRDVLSRLFFVAVDAVVVVATLQQTSMQHETAGAKQFFD